MKTLHTYKMLLVLLITLLSGTICAQTLRVATINVWSGLDYRGFWKMNEYEKKDVREERFKLIARELKKLKPDIILMQELNPVRQRTSYFAKELGYDEIHITINSGLKLVSLGCPSNLNEGIAILAKKQYKLKFYNALKLLGSTGAHGDYFSFQFDEANFMLVGKIMIKHTPVYIANTHLISSADKQVNTMIMLDSMLIKGTVNSAQYSEIIEIIDSKTERRMEEVDEIIEFFSKITKKSPVIIGGDFNTDKYSDELKLFKDNKYFGGELQAYTWNSDNPNVLLQDSLDMLLADRTYAAELENTLNNRCNRQIDFILVNGKFAPADILKTDLILDKKTDGIQPSDHYGVLSEINIAPALDSSVKEYTYFTKTDEKSITPIPLLSYDTDVGFGFGGKCFFLNQLGWNESFDIILFGSTLGERWGRFVFSIPDFELRQGKTYPAAIDFIVDYDVYLKNRFFGIGDTTKVNDLEYYTKVPLNISLIMNNGIKATFVTQIGLNYKNITNKNYRDSGRLEELGGLNTGTVYYTSIFGTAAYDSRNSYIKPSKGILAKAESEWSPDITLNNVAFLRLSAQLQGFTTIFYPTAVLAGRIMYQTLFGNNLPVQVLLPIGGSRTLRGFPQDRFLDATATVCNLELRLPLYWRFGLVIGADLGGVSDSHNFIPDKLMWNSVFGLRYDLDTYLIRLDLGFSKESMGFYLNFNHMF